jgi:GT2 family glycosyltransferase
VVWYDCLMVTGPAPDNDRIVLAVGTRNRADHLERTLLPSLRRIVDRGFRVVVVDQSDGPETEELLAGVGVRYLRSAPGLSRARNVAIAATGEPLVAFTDDDVSFPEDWLTGLVAVFDAHPGAGAVCGRACTPGGQLLPGAPAGEYRWPTTPFQLGSGFNMAFRRTALEAAGPFDEDLGVGARFRAGEDTDMFYRVLRIGWSIVCSDDVPVVHDDGRSPAEQRRVHRSYGFGAGAQTAKHLLGRDLVAARIALSAVGRQLYWAARHVLARRPAAVSLSLVFALGVAEGFARALPYLHHRSVRDDSPRPSASRRRA